MLFEKFCFFWYCCLLKTDNYDKVVSPRLNIIYIFMHSCVNIPESEFDAFYLKRGAVRSGGAVTSLNGYLCIIVVTHKFHQK